MLHLTAGYVGLPPIFHAPVTPTPLPDPSLVAWNPVVARDLGLPPTPPLPDELTGLLSGNATSPDCPPTASAYAGHQFGVWVPELGDGRAIILGDLTDCRHQVQELQLKGAGLTRWSRMGDGRAVLRSTIREYLASAAMSGLGIPSTRALAIFGSDLPVYRERTERAAVLARLAPTHVRFGTFEYLAARRLGGERRMLADWVIERFFPHLLPLAAAERYDRWYEEIVTRTARLMAMWIAAGFSHGVMNTDNFSILGLTLDYGPFGWLDRYDPSHICNHSDQAGRYAFSAQPRVGLWNSARLGEALFPLVSESSARATLSAYAAQYESTLLSLMRGKLGLATSHDDDVALIADWLELLRSTGSDYTRSHRALSRWSPEDATADAALRHELPDGAALDEWLTEYRERLTHEVRDTPARHAAMLGCNPKFVLRNWVAEEAIQNAATRNYARVDEVRAILDTPFDEHPEFERFAATPPEWASGLEVSCSS